MLKDQVAWKTANIAVAGEPRVWHAGDLLPDPASDEESQIRNVLRLGGAIRAVEVVYTPEEIAAAGQARAEAAAGVTTAAETAPAPAAPAAAPVIVGAEDDAAPKGRTAGRAAGGKG